MNGRDGIHYNNNNKDNNDDNNKDNNKDSNDNINIQQPTTTTSPNLSEGDVQEAIGELLIEYGLLQAVEDDLESAIDPFPAEDEDEPGRKELDHVAEEFLLPLLLLLFRPRRVEVEKENVADVVANVF